MTPQICIGTAQFGLNYGITNSGGQVSELEVKHLLSTANELGIHLIDTAQAYGNAESVLGRNLPIGHDFRIISKLPAQSQLSFSNNDIGSWEYNFETTCKSLGVKSIDSFLIHSSADLRKIGAFYLESWLLGLKERGLVRRLGVSIYGAEELKEINPALLDLVQLPLSVFDQRLLNDGTIQSLYSQGVSIHARSIFLQGLLLTPAQNWPRWASDQVRSHQQNLELLAMHNGCQLLDLALNFAKSQKELEAVVVGICNIDQLTQLFGSWSRIASWEEAAWSPWAINDPRVVDPRLWPPT